MHPSAKISPSCLPEEILIVDDSSVEAEILRRILVQAGYQVPRVARDGKEGLQALREHPCALVMSDIKMPLMNGYELCREIKLDEKLHDIPVMLLTALSEQKDIILALKVGADGYVIKPYVEDILLGRIRSLLSIPAGRQLTEKRQKVQVEYAGEQHIVDAESSQMTNLLLSVYENSQVLIQELMLVQDRLRILNENLDAQVRERSAALQESENRYRSIVEGTGDWLWEVDEKCIFTYSSQQVDDILGYRSDEILGQSLYGFMWSTEINRVAEFFRSTLTRHNSLSSFETSFLHKNGRDVFIEMRGVPCLSDRGNILGYRGINRDITERIIRESALRQAYEEIEKVQDASLNIMADLDREVEDRRRAEAVVLKLNNELEQKVLARTAQLELAKQEVEQASRNKDEFLAAISHELKTPLNHILGFSELLKEGLSGELNAEQQDMARDIHEAGSRQLAIVNSLIELAKLQAGKHPLRVRQVDPAKLLEEIAVRYADQASASGLDFSVEIAEDTGVMLLDDEVITLLLDQLLINAFKFTPSGGMVSLTARRVPRTKIGVPVVREASEYLELGVVDNGPYIAPETLSRLFRPFVQGDGRLSRSHGGTGIGLFLVRLLAELHGGSSGVESRPGEDTRFQVWLPCDPAGVNEGEP